jgi:hypothetical protein
MREWIRAVKEGVLFYFCIIRRGWWKSWPFLPLPPSLFIKFRLDTAYGEVAHGWDRPPWYEIVGDTKRFLLWRRKGRLRGK